MGANASKGWNDFIGGVKDIATLPLQIFQGATQTVAQSAGQLIQTSGQAVGQIWQNAGQGIATAAQGVGAGVSDVTGSLALPLAIGGGGMMMMMMMMNMQAMRR